MTRTIRTLSLPEIETLLGWAADEGWNPGVGDAAAFQAADPDGFLGAFVGGEMVAGISAVAYGQSFGFIGLYIARKDRRGEGHGKAVWDAGMARLGSRTIGLDGVPEQQANYSRMGFVKSYETVRMSGARALPDGGAAAVTADLLTAIATLDRECFPEDRTGFLSAWLEPPRGAMAIVEDRVLAGYGVLRPCLDGYKIGPLYARSRTVALSLMAALANAAGGSVQIDVPMTQGPFLRALTDMGMTAGFSTARMYRGPSPSISQSQVFGISTLELG